MNERLSIYKRFANCDTQDAIDDMQEELVDRFGELPEQVRALIESHRLRLLASKIGIDKIDAHEEAAILHFQENPPIEAIRIIELIQQNRHIKLHGQDKLRITANMPDLSARISQLKATIRLLSS